MTVRMPDLPSSSSSPAGPPTGALTRLPAGPLTTAELTAALPAPSDRRWYRRIWHGMYRREDQVDDLRLRSLALARVWPEGVLRGRSAALLWGDDSAARDALPEIWLPATRRACTGRVYRYGAMPAAAITAIDGVRVTTPLRTCRDLAGDLPLEDAVLTVERLCAAVPGLAEQLSAVVGHPSGRGARRFAEVVAAIDPRSGSADSTRARLHLADAGFRGFGEGHLARIAGRSVSLPLADPVTRCAVVAGDVRAGAGVAAERNRTALRRAGWTVIVVRHRGRGSGGGGGATRPADATGHRGAGAGVLAALASRWPGSELLPPLPAEASADPHGMWAGRRRPDGQDSSDAVRASAGERE